jgi:hypothetical protein
MNVFASDRPEDGYDIRTVQEFLGHEDVLNRGGRAVHSLLDGLRNTTSGETGGLIRTGRSA